jgi:hypothetical protein
MRTRRATLPPMSACIVHGMARHQQTNKPLHVYSAPTLRLLLGSPPAIRVSALSAASSVFTPLVDTQSVSADCSRHRMVPAS